MLFHLQVAIVATSYQNVNPSGGYRQGNVIVVVALLDAFEE